MDTILESNRMSKEIIVNSTILEDRIAILDQKQLVDYFFERKKESGIVGNIYKASVKRVLPGMQAAFVDIGHDRAAFLYVGDVHFGVDDYELELDQTEDIDFEERRKQRRKEEHKIETLLREKQEILIQVAKGPIGSKGARVTSHVSLPGRYLVFMPTVNHIGVSKRIENPQERKRLKEIVVKFGGHGGGFIVRTAAEKIPERALQNDIHYLTSLWKKIQLSFKSARAPALLHADLDLLRRIVRDYMDDSIHALVIDSPIAFRDLQQFVRLFDPELRKRIRLFKDKVPIFDHYGIEIEISRALGRRIWLKSGGYIIIEHTEALTAIDVNTGRYIGEHSLEDTILKTNLEAVKEIVYQLRIRNIGGIIILDLIDMEREANKRKVFAALNEALKSDRARITINKISSLGLVEMTRKRVRESLNNYLCESCYYCEGRGYLKSKKSICYDIYREIEREAALTRGKVIYANVHSQIAELLCDSQRSHLEELEHILRKKVVVRSNPDFHIEQYDVIAASRSQKRAPMPKPKSEREPQQSTS